MLGLEQVDGLLLAAVRPFAPRLAIHVDVRITERGEEAVHGVALVDPCFHFLGRQFRTTRRFGEHIDKVMRRLVVRVHNHVAHRAPEFRRIFQLPVFHPPLRRHQIKKFHHAGRIDLNVAMIIGLNRLLRIAQINERGSEFISLKFFVREFCQRHAHGLVDRLLQFLLAGLWFGPFLHHCLSTRREDDRAEEPR